MLSLSPIDRLAQFCKANQILIGDAVLRDLYQRKITAEGELAYDHHLRQFIHALNTSDWLSATYFLHTGNSSILRRYTELKRSLLQWIAQRYLKPLYRAAEHFERDKSRWQGQLREAYQFGKLPVYSPTQNSDHSAEVSYTNDLSAQQHGRNLIRLLSIFHAYEQINQLYQPVARTTHGIPIRFTQGHNWSYAHALFDFIEGQNKPPTKRRILVNWDAHRDLSPPFRHLSQEFALVSDLLDFDRPELMRLMQSSGDREQTVQATSMISIAGWILPLLSSGGFEYRGLSELVLVVPPEAQNYSAKDYWPGYGKYKMRVGDLPLTASEVNQPHRSDRRARENTVLNRKESQTTKAQVDFGKKNVQNGKFTFNKSIHSISENQRLQTLDEPLARFIQNTRDVDVHIVSPDALERLLGIIDQGDVYLSVDVDFAGTTQLGGIFDATDPSPHYPLNKTPQEELRHQQLIHLFENFYHASAKNIKGVSVANSPDYTAEESRRKPAAKIFEILTAGATSEQPNWIAGESNRVTPPKLQRHPSRHLLISLASALGISITGALFWHYVRSKNIAKASKSTDE